MAMITIEKDIVAGDILFWLRGNFAVCFAFFAFKARKWACCLPGRRLKKKRKSFLIFISAAHTCFSQPMKQFEFFGASRATRQRHFKTSSTGDVNDSTLALICYFRSRDYSQFIVVLCSWAGRQSWDIGEVTLLRQTRFFFLKEMSFSHTRALLIIFRIESPVLLLYIKMYLYLTSC